MSTELKEQPAQTKQLTIKQHLMSDGLRNQIAAALPKHMSADRMARVALTTINKTPKLAQCTQESFFAALMTCSQLGLEPDGRLAHLIPYGNQCQLIVDYKGLVDLAYRSKQVLSIHADVIYEGDEFEYDLGQVKKHTHGVRINLKRRVSYSGHIALCEWSMPKSMKSWVLMRSNQSRNAARAAVADPG